MQNPRKPRQTRSLDELNKNKVYIYTDQCKLCGKTAEYADVATQLQALGKKVEVRQVTLWAGWEKEAEAIGKDLPFMFDYDTRQAITIKEASELESLEDWLNGIGS